MGSEIIPRDEANEIKEIEGWVLIYGRRKVGKTFLIKNFLDYDVFFRVNRDGSISSEKFVIKNISNIEDFTESIIGLLSSGKTIVIDEFQRLPEPVLERISTIHPEGKLIFSGSSMRIIKNIFGSKSPLLGMAMQYSLGQIRPANILREMSKTTDGTEAIELSPYLADAWTIPFLRKESDSLKSIYEILKYSKFTIPALVGEIFTEEERSFTRIYEAILRLIGSGEMNYKTIASILADRKLISRADTSLVLPYIKNMVSMGLVEPLFLYSSKKKMYRLSSAIMEAFFYLDDKYDFGETDVSFEEVKPTLEKLRNFAIQNFIGDLFARALNGKKEYFMTPSNELDFIITVRNKPVLTGEVKWGNYNNNDVKKFLKKSSFLDTEKVFVTKKKKQTRIDGVKIMDVNDILAMVR